VGCRASVCGWQSPAAQLPWRSAPARRPGPSPALGKPRALNLNPIPSNPLSTPPPGLGVVALLALLRVRSRLRRRRLPARSDAAAAQHDDARRAARRWVGLLFRRPAHAPRAGAVCERRAAGDAAARRRRGGRRRRRPAALCEALRCGGRGGGGSWHAGGRGRAAQGPAAGAQGPRRHRAFCPAAAAPRRAACWPPAPQNPSQPPTPPHPTPPPPTPPTPPPPPGTKDRNEPGLDARAKDIQDWSDLRSFSLQQPNHFVLQRLRGPPESIDKRWVGAERMWGPGAGLRGARRGAAPRAADSPALPARRRRPLQLPCPALTRFPHPSPPPPPPPATPPPHRSSRCTTTTTPARSRPRPST
jgi:hypothetical protein